MKNALQEQLLKAGLATEEQLARSKKPKAKRRPDKKAPVQNKPLRNKRRGVANKRSQEESDLAKAWAARRKAEREEAAEKKRLKQMRKANRAKVRQLVLNNCQNAEGAEIPFQFLVGSNIKNVYVTPEQRERLVAGELMITFQDGRRCIISATTARQVLELDPEKLIINPAEVEEHVDDEYADYQVPDDLSW